MKQLLYASLHARAAAGSPLMFKIWRRTMPLEDGAPEELKTATKGRRLWFDNEPARIQGQKLLDAIALQYNVKYSWEGRCSSARDSLRLVLWAQSHGRNEEFMSALGWRHFSKDLLLGDRNMLLDAVVEAGLDREEADQVLKMGCFAEEVQATIDEYQPLIFAPMDGPNGETALTLAIPMLIFCTTNPRFADREPERLCGSVPQVEIEAVLRVLEGYER